MVARGGRCVEKTSGAGRAGQCFVVVVCAPAGSPVAATSTAATAATVRPFVRFGQCPEVSPFVMRHTLAWADGRSATVI